MNQGDMIYTATGELAIIRRIEVSNERPTQYYGLFCTGKLSNSVNAAGELNEFLLTTSDDNKFLDLIGFNHNGERT